MCNVHADWGTLALEKVAIELQKMPLKIRKDEEIATLDVGAQIFQLAYIPMVMMVFACVQLSISVKILE